VAHRNLSETFRLADTGNGCHRLVTAESRIAADVRASGSGEPGTQVPPGWICARGGRTAPRVP